MAPAGAINHRLIELSTLSIIITTVQINQEMWSAYRVTISADYSIGNWSYATRNQDKNQVMC